MENLSIDVDTNSDTFSIAIKLFNELITPLVKKIVEERGSEVGGALFFDLVYVFASAQIQANGLDGAESIVSVVNDVLSDLDVKVPISQENTLETEQFFDDVQVNRYS